MDPKSQPTRQDFWLISFPRILQKAVMAAGSNLIRITCFNVNNTHPRLLQDMPSRQTTSLSFSELVPQDFEPSS